MTKISTGVDFLDEFLEGGYDSDIVTTIFGPSGAGKTNVCLLAAVKIASSGKKVLFMDTEGGICVERVKQISQHYVRVLENMIFFNPMNFEEQKDFFERLKQEVNDQIGLIIVDSISMLYRIELGKNEGFYDTNASLGRQLAYLIEIARRRNIPVLLTSQVYSDFDNREQVKMVGGDLLKYSSKCLLELQKLKNGRVFVLKKHRSMPEGKEIKFKIVREGLQKLD